MANGIRAITFDLWDTMVRDNSDEPRRLARGLGTKSEDRRRILHAALDRDAPISFETVATAYDVADAAFGRDHRFVDESHDEVEKLHPGAEPLGADLFDRVERVTPGKD